MEQFSRIERMVGSSWVEQLQNKKVAVFGLGGVGSYVVEALARGGVGAWRRARPWWPARH